MYIRKKELIFYIVVLIVVIVAAHFIMIMNRTKVLEREKQAAVSKALRDYQVNNPVIEATAPTENSDDFFVNYRIERNSVRSKHIDILKDLLDNEDSTVKQKAQSDLQKLLNLGELENQVENLLKVRGLSDVVLFVSGNEVSVIVLANEFDQTKASQILDTVSRMLKIKYSNINIVQK
ncbi:SpoIIIAH-like family protein [Clostridium sp. 'deep sea']|uniref:SpoIIIAH-like family protein n=1 Tax=Clostridium sp. 'deep sea' TaxID=2779445 RepID=UPI0018963EF6|nr:SpoIIIAH-like family protein [Clostridium sp. 'deep sea']QOR35852.1 SpoIIIAH-like family protein [Clostridium sp. 'deep sea']